MQFPRLRLLSMLVITAFIASCSPQGKLRKASGTLLSSPAFINAHAGILVSEAVSGKEVYAYQSDKYFVPASNTKIITCYAAMKFLGDSLPGLRYEVTGDGSLTISGTGDPSFLHPEFTRQRAADFLKQFRQINWQQPIFDQALGMGWSWDDYNDDYMVQRSPLPMYGNTVRFTADGNTIKIFPAAFESSVKQGSATGPEGIDAIRDWDRNEFTILPGGKKTKEVPFNANPGTIRELLEKAIGSKVEFNPFGEALPANAPTIYSMPTDSLLRPMMHRSDNFFAEQTLMMVSNTLLNRFDIEAVTDTLLNSVLNDLPQRPRWVDGSGLSRYNLFTAEDFVMVLRKMISLPHGRERFKSIFPGGGNGTLKNYFINDSLTLYAKTGTLSGVVALSGLVYTKSGKELLFSILVNNNRSLATDVRREVERFIGTVRDKY